MEIQKILDQAHQHGIAAISAALDEMRSQKKQYWQEGTTACQAYMDDAKEREAKVKQRLDDLARQETGIKAKISAMQPGLVDTTVSGDTKAFNRLQDELANLEAQRAAIATQIQLLSSAQVPGDPKLYKAAEAKCESGEQAIAQMLPEFKCIKSFVREQAEAWRKLDEELLSDYFYVSVPSIRSDLLEVYEHFKNHLPAGDPSRSGT